MGCVTIILGDNMNRFTIVKRDDIDSKLLSEEIIINMNKKGWFYDEKNPQLVVCIGGDGTILKAFHKWIERIETVAFVGIHTGTLGFFTDYTVNELPDFYKDIDHKPILEEKRILNVRCTLEDKHIYVQALNEIRVENIVKTQEMDVYINKEYLETFRGNGVCISGQYGSTAYNRSIGGAVIFPGLDLLQMTEISGIHHRHARSLGSPLILDPESEITLKSSSFKGAMLCYDQLHLHMDEMKEVCISSYDKTIKFAHFNRKSHITRLNALF